MTTNEMILQAQITSLRVLPTFFFSISGPMRRTRLSLSGSLAI